MITPLSYFKRAICCSLCPQKDDTVAEQYPEQIESEN